jgi:hypothetical protein
MTISVGRSANTSPWAPKVVFMNDAHPATSSTTIRGIIDLFGASSAMKPILDDRHDYGHDIF